MPQPYNYTVAQPQVSSYFDAFRQGRTDRLATDEEQRNKALAQYLPGALQGDAAQREQALASANPDQQISLAGHFAQMDATKLAQIKEIQAQGAQTAMWADTPDKWVIWNAEARKHDPNHQDVPFEQRDLILAQGQTLKDQIDQAFKEKSLALDESRTKAQNAASYASAEASRAAAKQRSGMGGFDNTTFDNISSLRKEYAAATKTFGEVRDAFGRIQASAKNPSAAGDLSLIFNYMKVLDPGSTVREGEFATAQNATGIPERIVNAYNNAIKGERLNPTQRNDFVDRAGQLYNRQRQTYDGIRTNYNTLANKFGFDPSLVTFDQTAGIVGPPAGPVQRPTITGPNGEKMTLSEDGTQWVPLK